MRLLCAYFIQLEMNFKWTARMRKINRTFSVCIAMFQCKIEQNMAGCMRLTSDRMTALS